MSNVGGPFCQLSGEAKLALTFCSVRSAGCWPMRERWQQKTSSTLPVFISRVELACNFAIDSFRVSGYIRNSSLFNLEVCEDYLFFISWKEVSRVAKRSKTLFLRLSKVVSV